MVDTDDYDLARVVTKSVQHSVGTATGRPDASESPRNGVPTRRGCATRVVVRKSMTAVATASGSRSVNARLAGGV